MSKKSKIKVVINNEALAATLGVKPKDTVEIECRDGVPVERYWRNRFRDCKVDKCITLPGDAQKSKPKSEGDK